MNKIYKFLSLAVLLSLATTARAYDFGVANIYYNITSATTVEVTYKGGFKDSYKEYSGAVNIPETVTPYSVSELKTYRVTSIGNYAFDGCNELTSITIPNSVTKIGTSAFYGCSGLTSIHISDIAAWCNITFGTGEYRDCYANPLAYAKHLYLEDEEITELSIPESVTTIGNYAFYGCSGLTSITIPSSVTNIGTDAFSNCSSLQNVYISDIASWCGISFGNEHSNPLRYADHLYIGGEEVKELVIPEEVSVIRSYAFYGMKGVSKISVLSSETAFGNYAFAGTYVYDYSRGRYHYLSVDLPDDLTSIDKSAFGYYVYLLVSPGTNTLLTLWENRVYDYHYSSNSDIVICSKDKYKRFPVPYLSYTNTHSTATVWVGDCIDGFTYTDSYGHTYKPGEKITIVGEYPDSRVMSTPLYVTLGSRTIKFQEPYSEYNKYTKTNERKYRDYEIRTKVLNLTSTVGNKTASSMALSGRYGTPDVEVTKETWVFDGKQYEGKDFFMKGLLPGRSYSLEYIVSCHPAGVTSDRSYTYSTQGTTAPLTLTTEQPKVISVGNVVVSATSNLDDAEENVGFEWRRTDWTDDFASNSGEAYLFEGTMEGYIRNLYAEKLWKYRPYYEAGDGTRYYGEWVGIDPTNTSYFEPTVHTYATVEVKGSTAAVKGYVQRGTDDVAEQGFAYWKTEAGAKGREGARRISSIPDDATTVVARGKVMTATLTGLEAGTQYSYVAYVITDEGETFYGEEQTFRTDVATGIEETTAAPVQRAVPQGVFNLSGQRLSASQKGLNIINGKKVLVK